MPRDLWMLALAAVAVTGTALAESNIDPVNKFAWGENIGWTNWYDAGNPAGAQGVRIDARFLSGFIWAENVGWINVGDGGPANGVQYANVNGLDFGVNRDSDTDALSGLAWGENVGWINFDAGALAVPPNPARLDATCRLRGYVWGENIGWINLDDAVHFVAAEPGVCAELGDMNCDGAVNGQDIDGFVYVLFGTPPYTQYYEWTGGGCNHLRGDMNCDGAVNGQDIDGFVAALFGT